MLHDISLPIAASLPTWPGDPSVSVRTTSSIAKGDPCTVSAIQMGAHTGTHLDAPGHYIAGGSMAESISLDTLIGRCLVIESSSDNVIDKSELLHYRLQEYSRVLFKTSNSEWWRRRDAAFHADYVALGMSAAEYLVELGTALVGIDYLSIEKYQSPGNPVHRLLLNRNIAILEGLNLSGVAPGEYELICLPLKLIGCEGAPVRALLRERGNS